MKAHMIRKMSGVIQKQRFKHTAQLAFTGSKLTIETLGQGVEFAQS